MSPKLSTLSLEMWPMVSWVGKFGRKRVYLKLSRIQRRNQSVLGRYVYSWWVRAEDETISESKSYSWVLKFGQKKPADCEYHSDEKTHAKGVQLLPEYFQFPRRTVRIRKVKFIVIRFAKNNVNAYYIVKPCSDSQGRGIYLTKQLETNSKE